MMRIGMILDNEYTTDARVPNEAKYLVNHGHEVYVLCLNFNKFPFFENIEEVNVVRFNMSRKRKNLLFGMVNTFPLYDCIWTKKIKEFIRKYQPDALHVHDLYMAKAAYDANKNTRLPITLDLHENFPSAIMGYTWATSFPRNLLAKPKRWKRKEYPYLSYAANLVVLSDAFRQTLCTEYPMLKTKKFVVYPNVPDTEWFLSVPVNSSILGRSDKFVLLYFGVIGIRRGMVTCFEALKRLIPQIPEIQLLMIGPVDKADQPVFQQYAENTELKNHIIHYPWKDIAELPSYITASDICLAPSVNSPQHDSGIGNKVFQYMLFERAVVLNDSRPHQELINEARCGCVFHDLDVDDFAEKIKMLYLHPEMRKEMGQNGKKAVMKKYNLAMAGQSLVHLYECKP